jgi:hypothetical protein
MQLITCPLERPCHEDFHRRICRGLRGGWAGARIALERLQTMHVLIPDPQWLPTRREDPHAFEAGREPVRSAVQALTFPAIQLFVERAAESLERFELSDADAPIVAEICRKLEGIALAIELAASHRCIRGTRAVHPPRGPISASEPGEAYGPAAASNPGCGLDWSYEILPEYERTILRRLGVFAGPFTLESASAVAADSGTAAAEIVERVANLAAKSLVSADVSGAVAHYRLLDTTRAYVLGKLRSPGCSVTRIGPLMSCGQR